MFVSWFHRIETITKISIYTDGEDKGVQSEFFYFMLKTKWFFFTHMTWSCAQNIKIKNRFCSG